MGRRFNKVKWNNHHYDSKKPKAQRPRREENQSIKEENSNYLPDVIFLRQRYEELRISNTNNGFTGKNTQRNYKAIDSKISDSGIDYSALKSAYLEEIELQNVCRGKEIGC